MRYPEGPELGRNVHEVVVSTTMAATEQESHERREVLQGEFVFMGVFDCQARYRLWSGRTARPDEAATACWFSSKNEPDWLGASVFVRSENYGE